MLFRGSYWFWVKSCTCSCQVGEANEKICWFDVISLSCWCCSSKWHQDEDDELQRFDILSRVNYSIEAKQTFFWEWKISIIISESYWLIGSIAISVSSFFWLVVLFIKISSHISLLRAKLLASVESTDQFHA